MLDQALERQRANNQPLELRTMKLIEMLVSTNKGWLIRQCMKGAAALGTIVTTWLVARGVAIDHPEAITGALTTLAVGLGELVLSRVAKGIETK